MSYIGNAIWLIFGGILAALVYIIGGIIICLTVVGIPFGLQCIKLGVAMLTPFGKELHRSPRASDTLYVIMNLIWFVLFGWQIALLHLILALILALTLVGLPFAKQHIKLIPLALFPFGHDLA
ncbi:MAG: YccF domain-containing protein [Anaerolineae bacterium]